MEKAAEKAAERAVEKAFDNGNITTESKIIREFYSNIRKDPQKEQEYDDYDRYNSTNDEGESEEVHGVYIQDFRLSKYER